MDKINTVMEFSDKTTSLLLFLSLLNCLVLSLILKYVYIKKSNVLSNKAALSSLLPTLAIITFLVISVVKSSIALSLGLVGALSIVRFRTPIKDPEELVYIFFSIAIGIGCAANQLTLTSSVFLIAIIFIWFFLSQRNTNNLDYNIIIEIKNIEEKDYFSIINQIIKKNFEFSNFIKLENIEQNNESYVFKCSLSSGNEIKTFKDDLKNTLKHNYNLHIFESEILT